MVFSVFKKSLDFHGYYQRLLSQNRAHRVHWHSTTMSQALPFLSPTPSQTIDLKDSSQTWPSQSVIWPCIFLILYSWALAPGLLSWHVPWHAHISLSPNPLPMDQTALSPHALTNFVHDWKSTWTSRILTFTSHRISHSQTVARRRTALRPSGSFEPADSCTEVLATAWSQKNLASHRKDLLCAEKKYGN